MSYARSESFGQVGTNSDLATLSLTFTFTNWTRVMLVCLQNDVRQL